MYEVILFVHLIFATLVSTHVLLAKKPVGATVGWLGVAWLSPIIGSLLYVLFGVNRVARRATRIRRAAGAATAIAQKAEAKHWPRADGQRKQDAGTALRNVVDALNGFPLVSGNSIDIFQNGDEAYPEMLAAIRSAKKTVALSTYIFRMDDNGRDFVDALKDAKARGVEIKVLIDGIGGGFFRSAAVSELSAGGIDARRFMFSLLPWKMSYLNLRNHKKLLIVDGSAGFVGGMNIGSENLLRRRRKKSAVRDTHFRFTGPVIRQLMESFVEDWHFTSGEELSRKVWVPQCAETGPISARVVNSGPDHELGNVEIVFAAAIAAARKRIRIVTPYFLPDDRISYLMELAAMRGVEIDIALPAETDFKVFDWAMRGHLALMALENMNCRCSPQPFDHSKLITVDGSWCAIGSPNWDVRSMELNFEILVECHDRETASRIDQIIDEKMEESAPYNKLANNWSTFLPRLRNALARLFMPYL